MSDRDRQHQIAELKKKKGDICRRYDAARTDRVRLETAECFWAGNGIVVAIGNHFSAQKPKDNWTDLVRTINTLDRLENERRKVRAEMEKLGVTDA